MQKWLDDSDILMFSRHNESELIVAERFIKTLKGKIYKKLTSGDSRSYLVHLNKLVD